MGCSGHEWFLPGGKCPTEPHTVSSVLQQSGVSADMPVAMPGLVGTGGSLGLHPSDGGPGWLLVPQTVCVPVSSGAWCSSATLCPS
jgi:hypothetical protein